jgi:hypothetical protein
MSLFVIIAGMTCMRAIKQVFGGLKQNKTLLQQSTCIEKEL